MDFKREDAIFSIGAAASLWRVKSGVVRLDQRDNTDQFPIALASAGDLLGVESLCCETYRVKAQALTDVVLKPVLVQDEAHRHRLMMEVILQQPTRHHDMTRLRTGPVLTRVGHFLRVMGHPSLSRSIACHGAEVLRATLPSLRDIALGVDAKPETVCRALSQLLPRQSRRVETQPSVGFSLGAAALAF